MAQQGNWNNPGHGSARENLLAGVNLYTEQQCRDVIFALHSMHTSFDEIISTRDATGTFNGSSQLSFQFRITLERFLIDNGIDIYGAHVARNALCNNLFDTPGQENETNGLIGWYFKERDRPVLCQIISPWDRVRRIQISDLKNYR